MHEFEIIKKYFQEPAKLDENVILGIGDDAAIVTVPEQQQLVVCVDTIVSGIHFLPETPPAAIAHQALAVNLSDIAAMGAIPKWFTLALTLPKQDELWLNEFSLGLFELAHQHQVALIGGDTTRGPLTVSIQVLGLVPIGKSILRNGAKIGDKIYVTGTLGDAALGLAMLQESIAVAPEHHAYLQKCYQKPEAQLCIGQKLRDIATSAIDISDGLAQDLQHILTQSHVGAQIFSARLPLSAALSATVVSKQAFMLALTGGDDYELCFTIPASKEKELEKIAQECDVVCTCIGEIVANLGLEILDNNGVPIQLNKLGWEHF